MSIKLKNLGLIGLGMVAGVAGSMQFDALAQKNAGAPLPVDELRQLADVFGLIKSDYVETVEDKKLLTEAITGMVASLDPHSAYLDKKAFKELREGTQGKFVGLGIEVGMEDGYVKVISPIEESPAYRAGIKAGDLITRLDTTPVKGLTLDEAVKKMRGEPSTKITLTIARKDEDKPIVITIVRQEIRVQSVKAKLIEPGYAWVRVSQFQEPTVDDMARKITAIYAQDPQLKGLVLDLRNDPGGVLPGAIGVSAAFLPKDAVIVSTNGQLPDSKATFYARREFYGTRSVGDPLSKLPEALKKVPMVVLVNAGSASASEIVPDIMVDEYADGDGLNGLRLHEADLQKHLSNDKDKSLQTSTRLKVDELEEEQRLVAMQKKRKPLEFGSKEDFQLAQAMNKLKGLPVQVSKIKEVVSKEEKKDESKE